jgi:hypothetical protein
MRIGMKNEMNVTLIIMVLVMNSCCHICDVTVNNGFHEGFIIKWIKSCGLAVVVALPVVMVIMPVI